MALRRCEGFAIVTKSLRCKLERGDIDLTETKTVFNEVVEFYYILISTDPSGLDIPVNKNGGWRYYELLTTGDNPQYPLPFDCPSVFRRSAIRKAIGATLREGEGEGEGEVRTLNVISHDSQMIIKHNSPTRMNNSSFSTSSPLPLPVPLPLGSPVVVLKGNKAYLTFPVEKYVPATGGVKGVMAQDSVRVLGVDMDLDRNAAICSVLETNARGATVEVARHFIKQPASVKCRKRNLGQIAVRMNATGIIHKGFCSKWWERLHNRSLLLDPPLTPLKKGGVSGNEFLFSSIDMGRAIARQIVNLAKGYGCKVIAFEHLSNLTPCRGKYSRRSNQKRAYWLKSKIYLNVNRIAYQDYGILTTRVNPRNTSRLDPWGNEVWRRSEFPTNLLDYLEYQPGADWVGTIDGYRVHSGLNAARNVGMKAILRHKSGAVFSRQPSKVKAKKHCLQPKPRAVTL